MSSIANMSPNNHALGAKNIHEHEPRYNGTNIIVYVACENLADKDTK